MIYDKIRTHIANAEVGEAIKCFIDFVNEHYTQFASEIYIQSARFHQIEKERRLGVLPVDDYNIEINSINNNLLQIINSIEDLPQEHFKKKKGKEEVSKLLEDLENRFKQSRKKAKTIQTNATRLREKNDIARELGEIFINHPELIEANRETDSEGIINGIANKFKRVPTLEGIDFFETILKNNNNLGNFTKCNIANALGEIIYSGQLRIGDDKRVEDILSKLYPNSFQTVRLSILKVNAELDYFLGNVMSSK